MSFTIEQRDINTVKGYIRMAAQALKYSKCRSVPEDEQREAHYRAVRTLNELLEKIESFEQEHQED